MFIRKRDPRYKAHLRAQSLPPVALSSRSPPARQADVELSTVYIEQEWQKTSVSGAEDLEWALAEGNDDPEVFECVVCGKSFKSEAAWNSHERSKKHIRNVEVLRRQMEEEGTDFGLPVNPSDELGSKPTEDSEQPRELATPPVDSGSDTEREAPCKTKKSQESQAQKVSAEQALPEDTGENEQILPQEQNLSKRDKRRLREAKKQAQAVEHVSHWQGIINIILTAGGRNVMFARRSSKADRGCSITSEAQATRLQSQQRIQAQKRRGREENGS